MKSVRYAIATVTAAGLLAASGPVQAANPAQADFDACNREAQARIASPSASPSGAGTSSTSPSASSPSSAPSASGSDAQLQGMASAGQSDQAYQTAYRDCMKRRGF